MSTRETLEANSQGNIPVSGENATDAILDIPSCTIEDIDRGVFDLLDRDLPLHYTYKKRTKRVPIVFASGERFALIARKKPLRDVNNALILPVISVMRQGVDMNNEMGLASNQAVPHIIRTKLSRKDPKYQRIVNKLNLKNSDDLPSSDALLQSDKTQPLAGAKPGRFATRRPGTNVPLGVRRGDLLTPELDDNIFEVTEMPPVQFITATYEVTVWTQYVQQMNDIMMAIASNMQSYSGRSFRLETKKGYTFVAYLDSNFDPGNNFDDFTDDERIIRTSFTLKVPGYLLGSTYKGAPNRLRRVMSSPQVTFEANFVNGEVEYPNKVSNIPSGDSSDYLLDNRSIDAPLPGQAIADSSTSATDPRQPGVQNLDKQDTALIGGITNDIVAHPTNYISGSAERGGSGTPERIPVVVTEKNPFSGENEEERSYLKTRTSRNGETVYREVF
jgi:hypothetical protein